ncbi:MAG TPA: PhzF family phenazine biosynthesis protein [Gemmatimonadales bacterium]|nr:PhzF family phenazine biosynthesis protein [Gemmatimonadales bacterium]
MISGLPFYLADVFTDELFGGNQLAVFPAASLLETSAMQAIARELNLSETVFVFPPDDPGHTRKLRIFTPGAELPFAGHPTVGTAFVLASIGAVRLQGRSTSIVFEEGIGPVPVRIEADDGRPTYCGFTAASLPELGPPPPPVEDIAAVLSLRVDEIRTDDLAPRGASCGVPYLYIPLRDVDALRRARLEPGVWSRAFSHSWAPQLYPFAEQERQGENIRARMFAPAFGIPEDPATGSAAAALAGYLTAALTPATGTLRWTVDQGIEMGRPSRMNVECDRSGGRIVAVRVGGRSVMVAEANLAVVPGAPSVQILADPRTMHS